MMAPSHRIELLTIAIICCCMISSPTNGGFVAATSWGIPGATQTISGYDTAYGTDPICWTSTAKGKSNSSTTQDEEDAEDNNNNNNNNNGNEYDFPNELVENFVLDGRVHLLRACPNGTYLEAYAPIESTVYNARLRTKRWYNYTIHGEIDVSQMQGSFVASDHGSQISLQIVACDLLHAGFCSPFVHDQANARLTAEGKTLETKRGDRHGGTHFHSPPVILNVSDVQNQTYQFDVQIPMIVNDPGDFFVIGVLKFFTGDLSTEDPLYRYDVANALMYNERLVKYQDEAIVLELSSSVQIIVYCAVGIVATVILYFLFETIRNYQSQVMQLSQAPFLVLFLLATLVATVGTPLLQPTHDVLCHASHPIILISLQFVYAITFARLWRINAVISPVLRRRLRRHQQQRASCFQVLRTMTTMEPTSDSTPMLCKCFINQFRKIQSTILWCREYFNLHHDGLRKQVTAREVVMIVLLCTVPQLIFQTLALVFQPKYLTTEFNLDGSIGRITCAAAAAPSKMSEISISHHSKDHYSHYSYGGDDANGTSSGSTSSNHSDTHVLPRWIQALARVSLMQYSFYTLLALVAVLLAMAHYSRNLPSLFNESQMIYFSTMISVVVLALGMGILAMTDSASTSPDVDYMVWAFVILFSTLQMTVRIMWPKLEMIWSGETVLVSKLVTDYRQSMEAKEQRRKRSVRRELLHNVSGLNFSGTISSTCAHGGMNYDSESGGFSTKSFTTQNHQSLQSLHSQQFGRHHDMDDDQSLGLSVLSGGGGGHHHATSSVRPCSSRRCGDRGSSFRGIPEASNEGSPFVEHRNRKTYDNTNKGDQSLCHLNPGLTSKDLERDIETCIQPPKQLSHGPQNATPEPDPSVAPTVDNTSTPTSKTVSSNENEASQEMLVEKDVESVGACPSNGHLSDKCSDHTSDNKGNDMFSAVKVMQAIDHPESVVDDNSLSEKRSNSKFASASRATSISSLPPTKVTAVSMSTNSKPSSSSSLNQDEQHTSISRSNHFVRMLGQKLKGAATRPSQEKPARSSTTKTDPQNERTLMRQLSYSSCSSDSSDSSYSSSFSSSYSSNMPKRPEERHPVGVAQQQQQKFLQGFYQNKLNKSSALKAQKMEQRKSHTENRRQLFIKQGEAPPRRLLLDMVDLEEHLDAITTRVMCGLGVSETDWLLAINSTERLQSTFNRVHVPSEEDGLLTDVEIRRLLEQNNAKR